MTSEKTSNWVREGDKEWKYMWEKVIEWINKEFPDSVEAAAVLEATEYFGPAFKLGYHCFRIKDACTDEKMLISRYYLEIPMSNEKHLSGKRGGSFADR